MVNHKRVSRLYREEGLAVRRRRRKRACAAQRVPTPMPSGRNQRWSMDFMADTLADGRRLRVLTLVDDFTRECLATEVDTSLPGARVARVLDRIAKSWIDAPGLAGQSRRQARRLQHPAR